MHPPPSLGWSSGLCQRRIMPWLGGLVWDLEDKMGIPLPAGRKAWSQGAGGLNRVCGGLWEGSAARAVVPWSCTDVGGALGCCELVGVGGCSPEEGEGTGLLRWGGPSLQEGRLEDAEVAQETEG